MSTDKPSAFERRWNRTVIIISWAIGTLPMAIYGAVKGALIFSNSFSNYIQRSWRAAAESSEPFTRQLFENSFEA